MDEFFESLRVRAATIDELLSDAYEHVPSEDSDSELAASRLAAWCRSSAAGDWSMFARRLRRDGLSLAAVRTKFAAARPRPSSPRPQWIEDATWIFTALQGGSESGAAVGSAHHVCAFEDLLSPVVSEADRRLWSGLDARARSSLHASARECLRRALSVELAHLSAPALYERFALMRRDAVAFLDPAGDPSTVFYDRFAAQMRAGGFRELFEDKPVLLRLIAALTRQWIDSSQELLTRLNDDLVTIRRELLGVDTASLVTGIDGDLSDPHNHGRAVRILSFDDGSRLVYKPKDLRVDAAWRSLVERLNANAPLELRAARVLPRDHYGWSEFVAHVSCADAQAIRRSFQRAGALLALFHCFVGVDMHQENVIAAGEYPVPIDLEMILQARGARAGVHDADDSASGAFEAAVQTVDDSVLTVGLLPAYGRQANNTIFAIGGVTSNSAPRVKLTWVGVNTDAMRPVKAADTAPAISNLPHLEGTYARLGDHIDDFMAGFDEYARFLQQQAPEDLVDGFAGLTVRRVVRPTRFYYMLLQRLRDHRAMSDGVLWSAQADFPARLADWEHDIDPAWPLQRAERDAVVELNVPHFVMASDGDDIRSATTTLASVASAPGLDRAIARVRGLDAAEVAWQSEIIWATTTALRRATPTPRDPYRLGRLAPSSTPDAKLFSAAASAAADTLAEQAIRRGTGAAWVGLDWLGDAEVSQLVVLGPDLYNGTCGIALFLAAHAAVTGATASHELALAAVGSLRTALRGRHSARTARLLGTGAGLGLGSIVYAFTVISALLDDGQLLSDAHCAAALITDELIAADRQLDVLGGSAGAILGLLRLHRQTGSGDALDSAVRCGRHLLAQPRIGMASGRSWAVPGFGSPLNGMSHGAAGFAYALAALAQVCGSDEFIDAAADCVAFENATFNPAHDNWADLRGADHAVWHCKWCHGAPGIGLARAAMHALAAVPADDLRVDVGRALAGVQRGWPVATDTLCCGTLGSVEFLWEAADVLDRPELRDLAAQRLGAVVRAASSVGDYRWTNGPRRFNLGMFRGVAGVGYTALRRIDPSLPNILVWQ